ncbi:hypothetical protein [Flavobacterium macacae]|uniref:Uncharacterized protein n=1 Tax=Flavobacterium macacae TaxID=2488993 RepID=A0A3P3WFY0_9FLAO|nr:hypothetical protein [Flavobacterium macacae]RRJ93584.1 hypothetical protein EG849_01760 [Flavobacterium macacae]
MLLPFGIPSFFRLQVRSGAGQVNFPFLFFEAWPRISLTWAARMSGSAIMGVARLDVHLGLPNVFFKLRAVRLRVFFLLLPVRLSANVCLFWACGRRLKTRIGEKKARPNAIFVLLIGDKGFSSKNRTILFLRCFLILPLHRILKKTN